MGLLANRSRRAFSMLELVVSMAIVSIIMVAIGSTILMAASAIPNGDSPAEETVEISRVVNSIADELRAALHITDRSSTAVTFTIADRTGDNLPEVIRYAWSGTAGDPLTRQFNVGTVVTVLENVQQFDLMYNLQSVSEQFPAPLVESSELVLSQHDSYGDWWEMASSYPGAGQHFAPVSLPAGAVDWRVTRILFMARQDGAADGETRVQLRLPEADGRPTTTVIAEQTLFETDVPANYGWVEIAFGQHTPQLPGNGLCLVLEWISGVKSLRYRYDDSAGSGRFRADDEYSWTYVSSDAMQHYIYGVATAPGPIPTLTRQYVSDVRVTLLAGDSSSGVETSAQTLNSPEALTAVWEADFSADPTLIDLNGESVGDWSANGGVAFDVTQLDNGIYWADGVLLTAPENDFTQPTTVELRFRDFVDDGVDGGLRMRVDWTGDTHAYIKAMVELSGGQQNLVVSYRHPTDGDVVLVSETAAPGEFFDLRLFVDPAQDIVNVNLDDIDRGTFQYIRKTVSKTHAITLLENGDPSGVQFDWVRVRVGGTGS